MIAFVALFITLGTILVSILYCMSGSSNTTTTTTPGTGENTNKQKENPDPHKALAKSREELGGKLSVRANELQVILGLPEKDGQVTIAVDMEKLNDPCYSGMDEAVSSLCEFCLVYLLIKSQTDQQEDDHTKEILAHLPTCLIPRHRILHYESPVGKTAFVRQIKPYMHIENDESMYNNLRSHVPLIVYLQCTSHADLSQKSFPHQIGCYDDLNNIELKP